MTERQNDSMADRRAAKEPALVIYYLVDFIIIHRLFVRGTTIGRQISLGQ